MKKSIYTPVILIAVLAMVLISHTAYTQDVQTVTRTLITPLQAGTATVAQGSATVGLVKEVTEALAAKESKPSYYVVLTPQGADARVSMTDKNDHSFTISGTSGQVDYMVFVKISITMPDPRYQRQSTHTGAPVTRQIEN